MSMPIRTDYHLHSSFSGDSPAPMEAMIQQAVSLGLSQICFTEHMDMDYIYIHEEDAGMFDLNTDSYLCDFIRYREKYADRIQVCFGVELGLQPDTASKNAAYAKAYDFDFIIASSHVCNGKDPYYPDFYEGRSEEEAYLEYFSSILDNLKVFTDFDVYGHLDYVVRYGPNKDARYSYAQYRDLFDRILKLLIENGKGIEINTGGIKYGLRELNPCTDIIKRYKQLGGEIITIGSDAHTPDKIANGFERAADILAECGFRYYNTFRGRTPEYHKL